MSWLSNWVAINANNCRSCVEKRGNFFCWRWNSFILFDLNKLLKFRIFPNAPRSLRRMLRFIQIIASWPNFCILSGGILIVAYYPEQSRSLDLIHIVVSYPNQCISTGVLHLMQQKIDSASYQERMLHLIRIMCYWVAQFATEAGGANWWPNLQPVVVASINQFQIVFLF